MDVNAVLKSFGSWPVNETINKTPPITPVRKTMRSRLSRKNRELHAQNSPTTSQHLNSGFSPSTQDSRVSPRYFSSSQDPSREIVWEMRPLSPLTQAPKNDDFMTNLCNSWKTIEKESSPGSDSLSKLWKKPHSTPVKTNGHTKLRSPKKSRLQEEISETSMVNEMLELQKITRLLKSKTATNNNADLKSNITKEPEQNPYMEDRQPFFKCNVPIKDTLRTPKREEERVILSESPNIFSDDDILAPDSGACIESEDDCWGDDESFVRGLSQTDIPELNAAFVSGSQTTTVPSTLSCENNGKYSVKETFQPLSEIAINNCNNETSQTLKKVSQNEMVPNNNMQKISKDGEKNVPLIDNHLPAQVKNITSNGSNNGSSKATKNEVNEFDLFGDDDFQISQEVISIMDQNTITMSVAQPEPTLSQKKRATAQEIARKREAALKIRRMKMKKSEDIIIKKGFLRSNSS